jgi:hypothetical protein
MYSEKMVYVNKSSNGGTRPPVMSITSELLWRDAGPAFECTVKGT